MRFSVFTGTFFLLFFKAILSFAQQQVISISRCGGADTLTIPNIIDNDNDGMDDILEQKLLNRFSPRFIQFSGDNCPGPAVDGSGDTNLVVSRIFPLPQQYARTNSLDSILVTPKAIIPSRGVTTGLVWYNTIIMINAALLYGKDCGLNGHTADVEGFTYSLKYIGNDTLAGWRYDTVMQNWAGLVIQSVSHASTLCEKIETKPYKGVLTINGTDSIFASPSKHGSYLTLNGCNTSFICDPGCSGTQQLKNTKPVNIGEPTASLVSDLGIYYSGYTGEDPWGSAKFLATQGGNAGAIKDKMTRKLRSEFVQGQTITSQAQICSLYTTCYGVPASSRAEVICDGSSYTFNGQQLTQAGMYKDTLLNNSGCDSLITLNLSVSTGSTYSFSQTACSSYNFNGRLLTATGSYYDTISNTTGCDSLIVLQLTILDESATGVNKTICKDSSFDFNGDALVVQGIYYDTLQNVLGCDSIITLNLAVSDPAVQWNFGNDTVFTQGTTEILVGGEPFGGTYSGPGVSGSYFYPAQAGAGIHEVTYSYTDANGCSGSANKYFVVEEATRIETLNQEQSFLIFPNPVKDNLYVQPIANQSYNIAISDVAGRTVYKQISAEGNIVISLSGLAHGSYAIQIATNDKLIHQTIIR